MEGEGREGDWECGGCKNRNYAFRSFCNRCKQPRLLVDIKTPADSKWLPRIGDWICTRCTNNNYASREKCNKCGQPKEVAAMPAIAMPGVSVPTYSHYFARALGGPDQKLNIGLAVSGALQHLPSLSSSLTAGVADKYGIQSTAAWVLGANQVSGLQYVNPGNQLPVVPKGWRNGDWICNCGFHNYSSRAQCKSCNASAPPALGTKRLASEEIAHDLENKRLNLGNTNVQQTYTALGQTVGSVGSSGETNAGTLASYPSVSSDAAPYWQIPVQFPQLTTSPALLGKGAKQWRNGDWMCSNCNNHNYASRSECNRCKTQRDATNHNQPVSQPVNAV